MFALLNTKTEYSFLDSVVRVDDYLNLAQRYGYQTVGICDNGNLHAAYRFITKAKAYNLEGIYWDVKGEYDTAMISYQQAIKHAQLKFPLVEGSAYNNIGLINWNRGNYFEALANYTRAMDLFGDRNKKLRAAAMSNIGLIYLDINNADRADEYFKSALEDRRSIQDEYGISVSYTNLGNTYERQGKLEEAILYYDSAVAIKQNLKDEIGLSNTLYNQSVCYLQLGKHELAGALLQKAEALCLQNNITSNNLTNIYSAFASLYTKLRDPQRLKQTLYKLKELLDKNKDERNQVNYYTHLSDLHEMEGDYKQSLYFYLKADSIQNKLEGLEVKKAINLYEKQFQTARKEQELAASQLKLADQKLASRKKDIILILLSAGIVIGLILFKNFRTKSKHRQLQFALEKELLIEQGHSHMQQQRLEISQNLHDSLGSQLTLMNSLLDGIKTYTPEKEMILHQKLNSLSNLSEQAVSELKNTIWVLNSKEIYLEDFKLSVLNFTNSVAEAKPELNIQSEFKIEQNLLLNSKQAINLFRTLQEIINNSIKYSEATAIHIELIQKSVNLLFSIGDNGKGFDYATEKNKSFGLQNIQNRIAAIGGKVDLQTGIGTGTNYTIQINLDHD